MLHSSRSCSARQMSGLPSALTSVTAQFVNDLRNLSSHRYGLVEIATRDGKSSNRSSGVFVWGIGTSKDRQGSP